MSIGYFDIFYMQVEKELMTHNFYLLGEYTGLTISIMAFNSGFSASIAIELFASHLLHHKLLSI